MQLVRIWFLLAIPMLPFGACRESEEPPAAQCSTSVGCYALDYGVTLAEADRRLGLQDEVGGIIRNLETAAGERLAGAWADHSPLYRVVLRLTGDDPPSAELVGIAQSSPIPVEVRTGADYSALDLERLRGDILADALRVFSVAGTYADVRTGEVVIEIQPSSKNLGKVGATQRSLQKEHGVPVRLVVLDSEAHDD